MTLLKLFTRIQTLNVVRMRIMLLASFTAFDQHLWHRVVTWWIEELGLAKRDSFLYTIRPFPNHANEFGRARLK